MHTIIHQAENYTLSSVESKENPTCNVKRRISFRRRLFRNGSEQVARVKESSVGFFARTSSSRHAVGGEGGRGASSSITYSRGRKHTELWHVEKKKIDRRGQDTRRTLNKRTTVRASHISKPLTISATMKCNLFFHVQLAVAHIGRLFTKCFMHAGQI